MSCVLSMHFVSLQRKVRVALACPMNNSGLCGYFNIHGQEPY
jgi:hypothetical protein